MSIDAAQLFSDLAAAAVGAAKGHAADLRNYLEARAKIIADGVIQIAADRAADKINDDDVRFAFDQIKKAEKTALLAVKATAKAAAQDAINAALSVATAAINTAIGFALL